MTGSGQEAGVVGDWREAVRYSDAGPGVELLHASDQLKVVLVGLRPGQALPPHPGPAACFSILDGEGAVVVDGAEVPVRAGSIVVAPPGSLRSVRATTSLAFLGALTDPASEDGPH